MKLFCMFSTGYPSSHWPNVLEYVDDGTVLCKSILTQKEFELHRGSAHQLILRKKVGIDYFFIEFVTKFVFSCSAHLISFLI